MALSSMFALLLSFSPIHATPNRAPAMVSLQFCRESADSLREFSPRELCDAIGGFPCSTATNMAQAVCLGTGEGMCAFLKSSDDARYLRRLRGLCNSLDAQNIAYETASRINARQDREESNLQFLNSHDYDRTSIYGAEPSDD